MPPKSKLPRTMLRVSPYRSPTKRKAFIYAYQSFQKKCFHNIRCIDGTGICVRSETLKPLDLAVGDPYANGAWDKFVKARLIRSLPPFCAEYLTCDLEFRESTMLGTVYKNMSKHVLDTHEASLLEWRTFNEVIYRVVESHVLRMRTDDFDQKEVLILNYLRVVELFDVFRNESFEDRFSRVFQELLKTLYCDFRRDSLFAITLLECMCADDDLKLSVFLEVQDQEIWEYLLISAKAEKYDFWGLWHGGGRLCSRFNPVAVMLGCGRNDLARMFMRYGFSYSNVGTVYEDRCHWLSCRRWRGIPIMNPDRLQLLLTKRPRDRMLLILDIFITFGDFDDQWHPLQLTQNDERFLTLLQISRSLPDPYVTPVELYHSLGAVISLNFLYKLIRICKRYGSSDMYDDDCRVSSPRRLVHLCRCAVRANLAAQFRLPEGIDELGLKESLRTYLLLES